MLLGENRWWEDFYATLVKGTNIPAKTPPIISRQLLLGSGIEIIGLVALIIALVGLWAIVRCHSKILFTMPLLVLLGLNLALIGFHARHMPEWHMPCWTAMKGSYLLPSMPAMALLFGFGHDKLGTIGRFMVIGCIALLIILFNIHVFNIIFA